MLGMAALGNLLQSYGEGIRLVFGCVAFVILILLLLKLILFPNAVKEELSTPIGAGVFATFPMALMLFSVYVKPFIPGISFPLWVFANAIHIVLILYFTKTYILRFDEKNVHTVWYIVYVGIVVASLTTPAYKTFAYGQFLFRFRRFTDSALCSDEALCEASRAGSRKAPDDDLCRTDGTLHGRLYSGFSGEE